jgi:hypothetical protein
LTRTQSTRDSAVPGAGTLFALRSIGLVLLARWLFSMSQMGYGASFSAMVSSPWASINAVFLFLLIVLPGAHARAERPFHPLPQWLRQALRFFAFLGLLFALWTIGVFIWAAGGRRTVYAIAETNGWLVVAPALYAAVLWICRPRALWRTNVAARRFAIGRYAVVLDTATRTAVVWVESRKLGQYDARELSLKWPAAVVAEPVPSPRCAAEVAAAQLSPDFVPMAPATASGRAGSWGTSAGFAGQADEGAPGAAVAPETQASVSVQSGGSVGDSNAWLQSSAHGVDSRLADRATPFASTSSRIGVTRRGPGGAVHGPRSNGRGRRSHVQLLWDSPAAAGHNRQTVFRVALASESDRSAARALDAALQQVV